MRIQEVFVKPLSTVSRGKEPIISTNTKWGKSYQHQCKYSGFLKDTAINTGKTQYVWGCWWGFLGSFLEVQPPPPPLKNRLVFWT